MNDALDKTVMHAHGPDSPSRSAGCRCTSCDQPGLNVLALQFAEVVRAQQRADARTRHLTWLAVAAGVIHGALAFYSGSLFGLIGWWVLVGIVPSMLGVLFAVMAASRLAMSQIPILNMVRLEDAAQMNQLRGLGARGWYEEQLRLLGAVADRQLASLNRHSDTVYVSMGMFAAQVFAQGMLALLLPG